MSKFVIRQVSTGFKFDLRAANGQVILSSEVYTSRAVALKGIRSICSNAEKAKVEDQTLENFPVMPNPKFELYQDRAGQYRFRMKARNGKIIGVSEAYTSKAGCQNGIDSVKSNAPLAILEG